MNTHHRLTRELWIVLFAVIICVPLGAWALQAPFKQASTSWYMAMLLLGQVSGIVGAQLFSITLILSARLKSLEFLFGGLDRMYTIHHRTGVIAFSLLALHPLFLAFRYIPDSLEDVMLFLLPEVADIGKNFGILSLLGMLGLLTLTFYGVRFSYPVLKCAHRFLGLAFFFGLLHMFFIPGVISSNRVIFISCISVASVGVIAFIYRTLLGKFLVPRFLYTVTKVQSLAQGVTEISLSPAGKAMSHIPGQFAILSLVNAKGVSQEEHPFTISSSYKNGDIRFSVKSLGDYTSLLSSVAPGVEAKVEGPFGEFSYIYGSSSQVWVAGGIGVTPFVSMAEDLLTRPVLDMTIHFFYSVRTRSDAVYEELFTALATKHPRFVFYLMPSDVSGFVTGQGILDAVPQAATADFFVCGPPPMMSALIGQLVDLHIPREAIHAERFALLR